MAVNPVQIFIQAIDQASPVFGDVAQKIINLNGPLGFVTQGFDKLSQVIGTISSPISAIEHGFHQLQAAASPIFETLIAQNIELRQQILSTAAQIASVQDIKVGGNVITDSVEAIKTTTGLVEEQIGKLRVDALQLVGVTSTDLVASFSAIANQSSSLGVNLSQAEQLTIKLHAAATTLGLPIQQAASEIQGIARGEINSYNTLAKSLGLNNERLRNLSAQGKLMDYLTTKTDPLVKGQALAASTFAGVTSNIAEIIQLTTQAAGSPLLDLLLNQLNSVYEFLKTNQKSIEEFSVSLVSTILGIVNPLIASIQPAVQNLAAALGTAGQALLDLLISASPLLVAAAQGIGLLATGISIVIKAIADLTQSAIVPFLSGLLNPVTLITAGLIALVAAIQLGLIPAMVSAIAIGLNGFLAAASAGIIGLAATVPALAAEFLALGLATGELGIAIGTLNFGAAGAAVAGMIPSVLALTVSLAPLIISLATVAAGVAAIALIRMAKDLEESNTAVEEFGKTTDFVAEQSLAVEKKLIEAKKRREKATKDGIALSAEQIESDKRLETTAKGQIGAIDSQIAALKEIQPIGEENRRNIESQVAELERFKKALQDNSQGVQLQNKPLTELGDTFKQLGDRAAAAKKVLDSPASTEKLEEASKSLTETIQKQVELGQITAEQGRKELERISQDTRLKVEIREQAEKAIADLSKKESENKINDAKSEEKVIQDLISSGYLDQVEGAKRITDAKKKELDARIDNVKKALEREEKEGRGGGQKAKELKREQKELEAEKLKEEEEGAQRLIKAKQGLIKDEQAKVKHLVDAGKLDEIEGEKKLTDLKQQELNLQLNHIQENLKKEIAANGKDSPRAKELKRQEGDLQAELAAIVEEGQERIYRAKVAKIDRDLKKSSDAIKASETAQLVDIQELENKHSITRGQAELERVKAKGETLGKELGLEKKHLAELEALPPLSNPAKEEERQASIRSIRQKTSDLTLQLAQQELAVKNAEDNVTEEKISKIERAQKKTEDIIKASEVSRLTQIQELENKHTITKAEGEEDRSKLTGKRLREELEAEKKHLADLEAIPKLNDPIKEEERQASIRGQRIKTAELVKSIAENELQQQQSHTRVLQENIDYELLAIKNLSSEREQSLQKQLQLQDAVTKSLDVQNKLLTARKELSAALSGYFTTELGILAQTARSEEEKKILAETTAAIKLKSLLEQQAIEREVLELNLQQQAAALEKEKIQNRIAQLQNRSEIFAAKAELGKTLAKKDALPEEIQAAALALQSKEQQGVALQFAGGLLDQQGALNAQQAQVQRVTKGREQQGAYDQARLEFANSRVDTGERDRDIDSIRRDIESRLFGATGESGGAFNINSSLRAVSAQVEGQNFTNRLGQSATVNDNYQPRNALGLGFDLRQPVGRDAGLVSSALSLPAAPSYEQAEKIFSRNLASGGGDSKLEAAISKLEETFKGVQAERNPGNVAQTNQITNHFNGLGTDSPDFAKKIEQQTINTTFRALQLARQKKTQ
jgi:hypothetical protein